MLSSSASYHINTRIHLPSLPHDRYDLCNQFVMGKGGAALLLLPLHILSSAFATVKLILIPDLTKIMALAAQNVSSWNWSTMQATIS